MKEKRSQLASIVSANSLDFSSTGMQTLIYQMHLTTDLEFQLPTNIRLGHLVEKDCC
jgi:hypothetical protein